MKKIFKVTVAHVAAPWAGEHKFTVTEDAGGMGFYADADDFGCGRTVDSPEAAIRDLVRDNGGSVLGITWKKTLSDFKPKAVPGLYVLDHFEAEDGSFIQVSPHGHGVYQDERGTLHEFHNMDGLKAMFA